MLVKYDVPSRYRSNVNYVCDNCACIVPLKNTKVIYTRLLGLAYQVCEVCYKMHQEGKL